MGRIGRIPADSGPSRWLESIKISTTIVIIITLTSGRASRHTVPAMTDTKDRLIVFDTTLRDGEQAPGFSMRIDEKIRLARQIEALGVDVIEAGFPIASEADAEAVRQVSLVVTRATVAALARCAPADIDRAAWSV